MKRALLLLVVLAGCGEEFDGVRFDLLTSPPTAVELDDRGIELGEGVAVGARAVALDDGEPMDEPPDLELEPCDPTVVGVAPALVDGGESDWENDHADDEQDPEESAPPYVIFGVRAGRSCVRVIADGREEFRIPVEIQAPISRPYP